MSVRSASPKSSAARRRGGDLRLVLVAFLALLLAWAAWAMLRETPLEPGEPPTPPAGQGAAEPGAPAAAAGGAAAAAESGRTDAGDDAIEVARPAPDHLLVGVVRRQGRGLPDVRVELVAGLDRGVAAVTDADGGYRLGPIWSGAAVARFEVAGAVLAERRFACGFGQQTRLDVDATPGPLLTGRVLDPRRAPLAGARVACDGATVTTGPDGGFALQRLASGAARVRVEHPDFAPTDVAAWTQGETKIQLAPGGALEVEVPALVALGEVQIYVLPQQPAGASDWPVPQPTLARPGTTVTIGHLPRADVDVVAFHAAAVAGPVPAAVRPGATARVALSWRPLPVLTGRVVDGGDPVAGAAVELLAADPPAVLAAGLGRARAWLEQLPFALPPATSQRLITGDDGRFAFGVPERGARFLEATAGDRRVRRLLGAAAGDVELALPQPPR